MCVSGCDGCVVVGYGGVIVGVYVVDECKCVMGVCWWWYGGVGLGVYVVYVSRCVVCAWYSGGMVV